MPEPELVDSSQNFCIAEAVDVLAVAAAILLGGGPSGSVGWITGTRLVRDHVNSEALDFGKPLDGLPLFLFRQLLPLQKRRGLGSGLVQLLF